MQRRLESDRNSSGDTVQAMPQSVLESIDQQVEQAGGEWQEPPEYEGSVGRTMFDTPSSSDGTVTVLLAKENIGALPSQSLVRIKSFADGRSYLGVVVKGPFAEPDGLRADATIVVTATVRGGIFMPKYHGRVQVELVGEVLEVAAVLLEEGSRDALLDAEPSALFYELNLVPGPEAQSLPNSLRDGDLSLARQPCSCHVAFPHFA
jgi:hypothetical protein